MSETEANENVGAPTISVAEPEGAERSTLSGSEAPTLEERKPSMVKFIGLVLGVMMALAAIFYGGWRGYHAYRASLQPPLISDPGPDGRVESLPFISNDVADEVPGIDTSEVPLPNLTPSVDYAVQEIDEPTDDTTSKSELPVQPQPVTGLTVEQYETLIQMLNENSSIMNSVMANQNLLHTRLTEQNEQLDNASGVLLLVKNDVGAVITGQEVLSQRLRSQNVTVKKIESSAKADKAAEQARKERPTFRISDHSEWGDSVTLMIESEDGFYQAASIGTRINGWILKDIDLKTKSSNWENSRGRYALTWK